MDQEGHLIGRIAQAIPSKGGRRGELRLGIGDDAALIAPGKGTELVLTCDAFLEGIHFLAKSHPPDSVGYKSLVRATSDLAAMGARPRFFLMTLALPTSRTGAWLDGFLRGMGRAAREMGMKIIGGDTTKATQVWISLTVTGEIAPGHALTRADARPGDLIYVSGRLGQAQLGLELIRKRLDGKAGLRHLLQPHLYPKIRLALGAWLASQRVASAMMDLSDGLSTDLPRLCRASGVGARIRADHIPSVRIPDDLPKAVNRRSLDPLQMALHGGDDYELLFTVPRHKVSRLRRAPGFVELTAIGEITREQRILLIGSTGSAKPLPSLGWDPFRPAGR